MPVEEPDLREWQTKEKLKRFLSDRFRVRLHISLLLLAAVAAGWIANRALFLLGVNHLLLRHVTAVTAAYCAFLAGVAMWIRWSGIQGYLRWRTSREILDAPAPYGRPPEPTPWWLLGNIDPSAAAAGGEGCLVVLFVVAVLAAVFGIGGYLIADAASFFSEIVFELLLAVGLVRRMRRRDPANWTAGVFRKTWPALIGTLLIVAGFGLWAQARYPDANTVAGVIKQAWADWTPWKKQRKSY